MSDVPTIDVLLVEDSPADERLTREALRGGAIRARLTVVSDGVEALCYLRREGQYGDVRRPDLVLLDLNLPKVDGREVLRQMKADEDLASLPVVVLTASGAEEDVDAAYRDADAYVQKPVDLPRIMAVIAALAGRS
ncbi:MAG TPA: response regulator [Verrucomicrobiae bacterium]|nr:response regulator [Verrucomicrobiae bacterium]